MQKEVLIIIPAYNEIDAIQELINALQTPEISEIADILVINDASSDNTNLVAKQAGIPTVTHPYNLGYGSALQTGYKYAVRNHYQYVIQIDSDGQHDPSNIPRIYQMLKEKDKDGNSPDIVIGSRFVEGSISFPISFSKRIAISFFRKFIYLTTGQNIMDPTSGLQGLSRKTFLYYSSYNHFDNNYPDANVLVQMLLLGFQIREIPAIMHERKTGTSMHSGIIKPMIYMCIMILSTIIVWIRHKKNLTPLPPNDQITL